MMILCRLTLLAAWFLVHTAVDCRGDPLAKGTVLQYISSVKTAASKLYEDSIFFKEANLAWYTAIRKDMESTIKRQCILNGVRIAYKARPVFRPQMITIAGFLLKEGTAESLSRRAAIVTAFACVGRSGEVALTHFNDSYWDNLEYSMTFD